MRVRCTRDLLAPALCSISRIAKKEIFPLYHAVLFTAIPGHMPEQGKLTLVGMGMLGTVGLFTQLPAIVEEEGQVLVPIEPLASYIETLHSGSLTLSQAREEIPLVEEQVQDQMALSLIAPERVAPLQIESASTSASGKCSINHARLHAWSSRHYPLPLVQDWGTNPAVTCTLQASLFKKALAACAPFAREGTGHKGSADEMYGVLVRLDTSSIILSATTATMLISYRLPLEQPASLSYAGLFEGKALFWIKEVLPKHGKITFALARDAQTQKLVLLLSTTNATWFCRSMDVPCPTNWEELLQLPHKAELLIWS